MISADVFFFSNSPSVYRDGTEQGIIPETGRRVSSCWTEKATIPMKHLARYKFSLVCLVGGHISGNVQQIRVRAAFRAFPK